MIRRWILCAVISRAEHFLDLPEVLGAQAQYLRDDGRMLTMIPNMSGAVGLLAKWMDRTVHEMHMPHDLEALVDGHKRAGLKVYRSGYICSSNFGILSACALHSGGMRRKIYRVLTRLSKGTWFFEHRLRELPTSKCFSPYLYVVSGLRNGC